MHKITELEECMTNKLRAGTAVVEISPGPGIQLSGYPHHPRPNKGVHDPLHAACLTLDDGLTRLAIICMDIIGYPKNEVKQLRLDAAQLTGIPAANIMISCSHTHSGPNTRRYTSHDILDKGWVVDEAYMADLHNKLVKLVSDAWNNSFDASIGVDKGYCGREQGVGGNRRNPNGLADPEVWTIGVKDASGALRACYVKYALHPTFLHSDNFLVSADYPGALRAFLNEIHPNTVILFAQGTSGNQSPRYFRSGKTWDEAVRVGSAIANEADRVLASMEFKSDVKLLCVSTETEVEIRELPPIDVAQAAVDQATQYWEDLKKSSSAERDIWNAELLKLGAENTLAYALIKDKLGEEALGQGDLPIEIQVIGIDDACIVGLPGEIFVEFGLTIQYRVPFDKCFVTELTNGTLPGYAGTTQAYIQGGYETGSSLLTGRSGEQMVDAAIKLVKST
jgi:hypothetical protein